MRKHFKIKLFMFTFLCNAPLYSMEPGQGDFTPKTKRPIAHIRDKEPQDCVEIIRNKILELEKKIPERVVKNERESLAGLFLGLGDLYVEFADATNDLGYYNEAALFYNYIIEMEKYERCFSTSRLFPKFESHKKLNSIQDKLVQCIGGNTANLENFSSETFAPYLSLAKLREDVKSKIKGIDNSKEVDLEAYIENSKNLFDEITKEMEKFLAQLYQKAEDIVGIPPCDYAVIGLGSMALKQMTPYSDLEFAILMSDQKDKDSSQKAKNYFKNLTQLVHFWVINLGESIIPPEKYGCDMRRFVRKAVNFDLGGKTPLGLEGKPYELICTVDHMLKYMKNENQKSEHIDTTLPYILQKVSYVLGNKELFDKYQEQTKEFLKTHGESRAIKILWEDCCEIDYANNRGRESKKISNIKQFSLNPSQSQGKKFNVKQEIYRLPDRFIYNLGLIYGINAGDNWKTINTLAKRKIINETAQANLNKALTFASLLRLKVYSYYNEHNDEIDWDEECSELVQGQRSKLNMQVMRQSYKLHYEDLQENSDLYKYFYIATPLTWKIAGYCINFKKLSQEKDLVFLNAPEMADYFLVPKEVNIFLEAPKKDVFFLKEDFYDDSAWVKADISLRLFKIKAAQKYQEERLKDCERDLGKRHPLLVDEYLAMGMACLDSGQYETATEHFESALEAISLGLELGSLDRSPDEVWRKRSDCYNNLGLAWMKRGYFNRSQEYFLKALEENKSFSDSNPNEFGITAFLNLGICLSNQCKFEDSFECFSKCLKMSEVLFGENHPMTAECYSRYGNALREKNRNEDAQKYLNMTFDIRERVFSEKNPLISKSYLDLAENYSKQELYSEALENFRKALKIRKEQFGPEHPATAHVYSRIAQMYLNWQRYEDALKKCAKALKIREATLGESHPETASSNCLMAGILNGINRYSRAITYGEKGLRVLENTINKDHNNIEYIYEVLTDAYIKSNNNTKALYYLQKRLKIVEEKRGKNHPTTQNMIVQELFFQGKYGEALASCTKVLQTNLKERNPEAEDSYKMILVILSKIKYTTKVKILQGKQEKVLKNENPFYIKKWGDVDKRTTEMTVEIAADLEEISKNVENGYNKIKNRIEILCRKYKDKNDQEIVKMLCFEAICLKIADGNLNWQSLLDSLKRFCKENIKLVNKIAKLHPEYFVEKEIVSNCIKYFPKDLKNLELLLQE